MPRDLFGGTIHYIMHVNNRINCFVVAYLSVLSERNTYYRLHYGNFFPENRLSHIHQLIVKC